MSIVRSSSTATPAHRGADGVPDVRTDNTVLPRWLTDPHTDNITCLHVDVKENWPASSLADSVCNKFSSQVWARKTVALVERMGRIRCGCAVDCWCRRPGLSLFRWVFPWWHRTAHTPEEKAQLDHSTS